jgi:hypothetical protein
MLVILDLNHGLMIEMALGPYWLLVRCRTLSCYLCSSSLENRYANKSQHHAQKKQTKEPCTCV